MILVIADRMKSGESLLSAIGFNVSEKITFSLPSELEDEDVQQERAEVQNYMTSSAPDKVILLTSKTTLF